MRGEGKDKECEGMKRREDGEGGGEEKGWKFFFFNDTATTEI